jgi:integrase/recombinase XerD
MTVLRQRMIEDMQLRGLATKTQGSYLRAVRQISEHYNKTPDQISEDELRGYFLYLTNERKISRSYCIVTICGLKFFYEQTLGKTWPTFELVKPKRERKLPVVLSKEEVQDVLSRLRYRKYQVCLGLIYACGLRLKEGVYLKVTDLDPERMLVHVHQGKGGVDRYVPLPRRTLDNLRQYWTRHRHPIWLFPAKTPVGICPSLATRAMSPSTVQKAFRAAVQESGIKKRATVHTLRHSYATHLYEAGVSLRMIQSYLGHRSFHSTLIYTHLTCKVKQSAIEIIDQEIDTIWV